MRYLSQTDMVDYFLDPNYSNCKKYIFGFNENTKKIIEIISVDGIIVDGVTHDFYKNIPIHDFSDVDENCIIVSAITNARPKTALARLKELGFINFIDYFTLVRLSTSGLSLEFSQQEMNYLYETKKEKFSWVRNLLVDRISKTVWDDIINFRKTGDLKYMNEYKYRPSEQYFEIFLNLPPSPVFVDGGGFDGFTSLEFAKRYPDYKAICFFEPVPEILEKAKKNLSYMRNVNFYMLGLYNEKTSLRFDNNMGSASKVSNVGETIIHANKLDDIIISDVSFIKLDIEGAELMAIEGMKEHIQKYQPTLAIAIYHNHSDFIDIPSKILSIRPDYKLYCRHYTESWTETILYFVPIKS